MGVIKVLMFVIHFLVTGLLVIGMVVMASKSDSGALFGGSGDVYRGATKGFEGFVERWMKYLAYGFLITSFLSALVMPRFF